MEVNIKVTKSWSSGDVEHICTREKFYTNGDNNDYIQMLNLVDILEPTIENIYRIAKDIYEHSEKTTINNIMYFLANYVVVTSFDIEGEK